MRLLLGVESVESSVSCETVSGGVQSIDIPLRSGVVQRRPNLSPDLVLGNGTTSWLKIDCD